MIFLQAKSVFSFVCDLHLACLLVQLVCNDCQFEGSIPIRTPPSRRSLDASRRKYDPEENALQQALAASMTETEGTRFGSFFCFPSSHHHEHFNYA